MEPRNYVGDNFSRVTPIYKVTQYNIACCYAMLDQVRGQCGWRQANCVFNGEGLYLGSGIGAWFTCVGRAKSEGTQVAPQRVGRSAVLHRPLVYNTVTLRKLTWAARKPCVVAAAWYLGLTSSSPLPRPCAPVFLQVDEGLKSH